MEILYQLAGLFLQAVPTVIIVFLFYLFLRWAFFEPIQKAMEERTARIEGAREEARKIETATKRALDSYNESLKEARAKVYRELETARQAVLDERLRLLKAVHRRAEEEVEAAKRRIAADLTAARREMELEAPALASQIARVIVEGPSSSRGGAAR
jgi:F-type H+-transporting ATPase subunit b